MVMSRMKLNYETNITGAINGKRQSLIPYPRVGRSDPLSKAQLLPFDLPFESGMFQISYLPNIILIYVLPNYFNFFT